jgi:serine/threonine protein kinase
VAIKTLTGGFSDDPSMLARFYEEGKSMGRLNHPNIVAVYDIGVDNQIPYIVMECVSGSPLDKRMSSGEPMPMPDRLRIVEDVCSALGYAHQKGVIHRDVKPANIFVQPDGKAKLLDFGIARLGERDSGLTRSGLIIGTGAYMAPERIRGETLMADRTSSPRESCSIS